MDTAQASITFVVRVRSDEGARVSGIVERVKTGEKHRFHDAGAIGFLITEMVRARPSATGPSSDAPVTSNSINGANAPGGASMRHRFHILMLAVVLGALPSTAAGVEAVDNGRVAVSPTRDLAFPVAWAGEWRITTTYRRGDTHEVIAVDDVTGVIRAREPVGLSALTRGRLLHCSGLVTVGRLDVSCSRIIADGACQFGGTFGMVADRTGETLVGSGELIAGAGCGALPAERVWTTVELLGFRLGHDPGDPAAFIPPLLTRFVPSSPLLLLAVTSRQVRPVIKDDCKDDGWMSFTTPSFKNQGQCIKFVEEQDKAARDRQAPHAEEGAR